MTRATSALLNLNFGRSFYFNPFLLPLGVYFSLVFFTNLKASSERIIILVLTCSVIVFMIIRNQTWYPFY